MRREEGTPIRADTDAAALIDRLQKLRNLLPTIAQEAAAAARREAARLLMAVEQSVAALRPPAVGGALLAPPVNAQRPIGAPAPRVWTATGLERQVFLDRAGRRRRLGAAGGAIAALLCALWLAGLVIGALGFSSLPALRAEGALARLQNTNLQSRLAELEDRPRRHEPTATDRKSFHP
jgi:hypothetical protein